MLALHLNKFTMKKAFAEAHISPRVSVSPPSRWQKVEPGYKEQASKLHKQISFARLLSLAANLRRTHPQNCQVSKCDRSVTGRPLPAWLRGARSFMLIINSNAGCCCERWPKFLGARKTKAIESCLRNIKERAAAGSIHLAPSSPSPLKAQPRSFKDTTRGTKSTKSIARDTHACSPRSALRTSSAHKKC